MKFNAVLTGTLGARMPQSMGAPEPSGNCNGAIMCFQWGTDARVEILECEDWDCFRVSWTVTHLRVVEDCLGTELQNIYIILTFSCVQTLAMVTGTGAQRSWSSIFPWGLTTRGGGQLTSQETCFRWGSHLKPLKRKFKPKIQFFRTGRNTLVAWLSQCGSQAPGRAWRWWRSSPCSTAGTRTATTSSVSLQSTRSLMWGREYSLGHLGNW